MDDPQKEQIDDIVAMLDRFMSGGGGHMNIEVAEDGTVRAGHITAKEVTTMKSLDCAGGNLACGVPTLFEGLDDYEEDPDDDGSGNGDRY